MGRIVHLAAQTSVVASIESPVDDLRVNAGATVHVLEYARPSRRQAGGDGVVGRDLRRRGDSPVSESAPQEPLSPYGIHKLVSEMHLRYYRRVHGVPTAPLRFFNVYGPRQDPHSPYSGVISIFMDRAASNREIVIFGDGEQTRDFVYVADVVRPSSPPPSIRVRGMAAPSTWGRGGRRASTSSHARSSPPPTRRALSATRRRDRGDPPARSPR